MVGWELLAGARGFGETSVVELGKLVSFYAVSSSISVQQHFTQVW